LDSGYIQESDAEYVNKKRAKRGEPPVEPIYTMQDAAMVAQHFNCVPYGKPFEPVPGVVANLVDAGHILGSAAVVMDIEEAQTNHRRKFRLWFSGDIGRRDLPLLRDPVLPSQADYMIMECTYGDSALTATNHIATPSWRKTNCGRWSLARSIAAVRSSSLPLRLDAPKSWSTPCIN